MKGRISMFIVAALVSLAMCMSLPAADLPPVLQSFEQSFSSPVLAPPLPQVVTAATLLSATPPAERLSLRQRRQLGFTRPAVIRATMKLARTGQLPSTKGLAGEDLEAARAEIKEAIAAEIMGDNLQAWKGSIQDDRDWSAFFDALISFLEKLMPLIQMLIEMFGGMANLPPVAVGLAA